MTMTVPPAQESHQVVNPPQSPVDMGDALEQVRQMPEFKQTVEAPSIWDGLEPYLANIREWIDNFFKRVGNMMPDIPLPEEVNTNISGIQSILETILISLVCLTAVAVVFLLLRYGRINWLRKRPASSLPTSPKMTDDGVLLKTAVHHLETAKQYASSGNYNNAVRQVYFASLCTLDETGTVPFQTGRTNGEYLTAITQKISSASHESAGYKKATAPSEFKQVCSIFEANQYGGYTANKDSVDSCLNAYQALKTGLTNES
ncbi:MAG: DUF4129 domain-containing protein [Vampirovibrio sp.]|nr:DUF4129 domain-containing protein [Vampirovibrio sp.]